MSTNTPAAAGPSPLVPRTLVAEDEAGGDDSTTTVFGLVGGTLILLVFLAVLCVGFFVLGSLIGGHPMTDLFLTPGPGR